MHQSTQSQHSPNFTNAQVQQVTYSIMTRLINYSNACGTKSPTKVVTSRCQQNILCKSTPPLTTHQWKRTPSFTFLIWLNMTMMHGHTSKDSIMQNPLAYTFTNNNVKVHLHLQWLVHQQLHYQVFTFTQSINHNSNKSHYHITINQHICTSPTISQSINIYVLTNIDFII